jgi:SAM-dependent methyltransferase
LENLHNNDTSPIEIDAYVLSKRSLGKNLIFCDFQIAPTTTTTTDDDICQAMLRREYYRGPNYEGYKRCLLKGTKLKIIGEASPTRNPGNAVFLIHSLELQTVPRQPQHIQILIQQALEGKLSKRLVAKACHQPESILEFLLPSSSSASSTLVVDEREQKKKWLKQVAKDVLAQLPEDEHFPKAADQVEFAKLGNFIQPPAPKEWRQIPRAIVNVMTTGRDGNSNNNKDAVEVPSVKQELHHHQDEGGESSDTLVSVQGWVQNRRRFDNNITMVSLVDELTFISEENNNTEASVVDKDRLIAVLHPDLLEQCAGLYSNVVAVETKVWVSGKILSSNDDNNNNNSRQGRTTLWIQQIRLVQSSSRSSTIRHLLDLLHDNRLELEEVADSLKLPYADALGLQQSSDATQRQWKANELAIQLQHSKRNVVKPDLLEIMEKYKPLSKEFPILETEIVSNNNNMDRIQAPTTPTIGMPGSKWQSKKRPQLEWMSQQIVSVLQSHPEYGKRTLSILDIGGGKGSLANYLGKAIENVQIHVVDICEGAVANGAKKAQRLNLPVQFQTADASSQTTLGYGDADVVVALHACGHLSDVALGHAVHRRAGFVIVPCCFNSNPHLTMPYHGGDGDGDDDISVPTWLGIPPDDWSALKLLAEVQGDIELANEATAIVCALRAKAAAKQLGNAVNVEIRRFPLQYSTRNTVLVGKCL